MKSVARPPRVKAQAGYLNQFDRSTGGARDRMAQYLSVKDSAAKSLDVALPPRPPGFCTDIAPAPMITNFGVPFGT